MTLLQVFLWMIGILAAIVVLCAGVIYLERKFPGESYDERQKLSRGNAYRLSFWIGFFYSLAVLMILIRQVEGEKTVEPYLLIFFGAVIQAIVYHTYCILTHSALPLSEKPVVTIVCYALTGLLQLWYIGDKAELFPLTFVGKESSVWINILCGAGFFYLALIHTINLLRKEKE